jgi:hypothetical protein
MDCEVDKLVKYFRGEGGDQDLFLSVIRVKSKAATLPARNPIPEKSCPFTISI